MTSARTKPLWMSVWISPAACHARRARGAGASDCAGLASPAVKKAIRSSSAKAPRTTRSQARTRATPSSARIAAASSSSSSASSASIRERDRDRRARPAPRRARRSPRAPRRRPRRRWRRTAPAWRSAGARSRSASARPRAAGTRARRAAGLQRLDQLRAATPPRRPRDLVARCAPASRRARGGARPARGRRRSARSRSSRCRRAGRRGPPGARRSSSPCARTTCTIASVSRMLARNWLPSPSPSCAPRDQARDVVEGDRVVDDLAGAERRRHRVQPLVARPARWRRSARSS